MGNFDFVAWPAVRDECAHAESYLATDPNAVCLYARRAVETLVTYLYELNRLDAPYRRDLAASLHEPAFQALAGPAIVSKLDVIRINGNAGAHPSKTLSRCDGLVTLTELFHVMVWATVRFNPDARRTPIRRQFDPQLAVQKAPLDRGKVRRHLATLAARDEQRERELAEHEEARASLEAELARVRAELDALRSAQPIADDHDYNEASTRDYFIDVLLREAGWPLDQPRDREYPVTGMPSKTGTGYVDYVLWGADGLPLAVVEAKKTRRSAHEGEVQAKLYADCLEKQFGRRPVIFFTNGQDHWVWDDALGYPPRPVRGFFTADELELMIQRRATRRPLSTEPISHDIAGRYYQERAIRAIDAAFDARRREALLVMATGSGKTRTAAALAQQMMNAHWAKRVLFLADRTALVRQAAAAFTTHLPGVSVVNLLDDKDAEGRVYASTYPTMMNLINQVDDSGRRFGPGYFDLVIIDEAHRSVYQRYRAIFDYFDAYLVGLTATPKDEIDHNTYRLFHLEDGVPTDAYGLDEAVRDGYLVPPRGISAGTAFTRSGVRYADLSEADKEAWDALDWGEGGRPDEINAEELNRFLFNADTVDKVLGQLMAEGYKVNGGDRLGKTIIFAKNQAHADFIAERFNLGWPHYAGRFAQVITHGVSYAQHLIDKFSERDAAPHIAISVDMLDTGIDVPEVLNLVFFKTVMSKSKFWQMIGRGTRLCPDVFDPGEHKQDFLVFDYCGNLEFFSEDLPGRETRLQASVTQRVFEERLTLVEALDAAGVEPELRGRLVDRLHAHVAGMTLDNVLVRPHRRAVERFAEADAWTSLAEADREAARVLGGLPSAVDEGDDKAKRFDLLVLRWQVATLTGQVVDAEKARRGVQDLAEALLPKTNIPLVAAQAELLERVVSDEWWDGVTLPMLDDVRVKLRGLMGLIEPSKRPRVYSDFADELGESHEVDLPGVTPGTNFERFQAKARMFLRAHEQNLALQRLMRNKQLTSADLEALGQMLVEAGGDEHDLARASEVSGGLGLFVRQLVGLDREAAVEAFAAFLDKDRYGLEQIRFVELIIDELTRNGVMEAGRLFEAPFTDNAPLGPDTFFRDDEVVQIADILAQVKGRAVAV